MNFVGDTITYPLNGILKIFEHNLIKFNGNGHFHDLGFGIFPMVFLEVFRDIFKLIENIKN